MPISLKPPALQWEPDQQFRVSTEDGSAIMLGRYRPRGDLRRNTPVILAHGLGTNRFNLDFDERLSVARILARAGFEAWVLELRGHGLVGDAASSSFDREANFDVAAALKTVISTGATGVHWVGHSRGGLLAYAHLARFPQAPIRSIVAMGTPVKFDAQPGVRNFVNWVAPLLKLPVIPLSMAKLTSPLGLPPDPFGKYLLNAANVDPLIIRQAMASLASDVPGGVARAFHRWLSTGVLDGDDGFQFLPALKHMKLPVFLIAGSKDLLAPPVSTFAAAQHFGGPVETFEAGVKSGLSTDYGHGDLAIGRNAPTDIAARIVEFLSRVD